MKKIVLILAFTMLCNMFTLALADESTNVGIIEPKYSYTDDMQAALNINSSGIATCNGLIKSYTDNVSYSLTVTLYKYSSDWVRVQSWSESGKSPLALKVGGTAKVTKGYKYKVTASATVKNSAGKILERPSTNVIKTFE